MSHARIPQVRRVRGGKALRGCRKLFHTSHGRQEKGVGLPEQAGVHPPAGGALVRKLTGIACGWLALVMLPWTWLGIIPAIGWAACLCQCRRR